MPLYDIAELADPVGPLRIAAKCVVEDFGTDGPVRWRGAFETIARALAEQSGAAALRCRRPLDDVSSAFLPPRPKPETVEAVDAAIGRTLDALMPGCVREETAERVTAGLRTRLTTPDPGNDGGMDLARTFCERLLAALP